MDRSADNLGQIINDIQRDLEELKTTQLRNAEEQWGKCEVVGSGNNYAWKFEDGRLICFQRIAYTDVAVTSSWGSMYYGVLPSPTNYAVAFLQPPTVSAVIEANGYNAWIATRDDPGTETTPPVYQLIRPTSATCSGYLDIVAYGVWSSGE